MSEKCSPDDPRRCQGTTPDGQCQYTATEGSPFCDWHNRGTGQRRIERKKAERYLIDQQDLRQSYLRQLDDKSYLDLRDEIALTHSMIERRLNVIKTDADIMMAVGPFTQMVQRLESMKISLMKLQQQLGLVLGKDELRALAVEISTVLDEELNGLEDKEERMDRLCKRLFEAIEGAGKPKDSE